MDGRKTDRPRVGDWDSLRVFLAVEAAGSIRAAATILSCSHSTVARRLDGLERQLGAQLFDRTPTGFVLSPVGERILETAKRVEQDMVTIARRVAGSDRRLEGKIRLTLPPPLAHHFMLPAIVSFRRQYAGIDVELISTFAYTDLTRHGAELAIRFTPEPDQHLIARALPAFRDGVYATPAYLAEHTLDRESSSGRWIGWGQRHPFEAARDEDPFPHLSVDWRFPNLELVARGARAGLGLARLPCLMGDRDPALQRAPGSRTYEGAPGWLVMHPDTRRLERARVLFRHLLDYVDRSQHVVSGIGPPSPA